MILDVKRFEVLQHRHNEPIFSIFFTPHLCGVLSEHFARPSSTQIFPHSPFLIFFIMPLSRSAYRMIPGAGSLTNLHLVEEALPEPHDDEVCVKIHAIGLNFADIFAMMGLYSATPKGSFIPGLEYAGVVQSVGKKVQRVAVGDAVMGVVRFGAYATHVVIEEEYVLPIPQGWTFAEGAAFIVQALTAYYALFPLGALQRGATVLIHSAAGGVTGRFVRAKVLLRRLTNLLMP
jgi:D-arabinose 1-dehydrogenase-like Zn-dependent alcohol dehydrogenase